MKPYSICKKPDGTHVCIDYDLPIPEEYEVEMHICIGEPEKAHQPVNNILQFPTQQEKHHG
jgi:hypothetical protein